VNDLPTGGGPGHDAPQAPLPTEPGLPSEVPAAEASPQPTAQPTQQPMVISIVDVDREEGVVVLQIGEQTAEMPLSDLVSAIDAANGESVRISGGGGVNDLGEVALVSAGVAIVSGAGFEIVRSAVGARLVRRAVR